MPKFEKTIVTEGRYRQWNDAQKKYVFESVPAERIKNLSSTFQKMKEKGIRVPAPWKHDFEITSLVQGDNGLLEDSTKNAGFWEDVVTKVTDDGKLALVGVIDVPGDPNDPNTPAGKVGKTVKDTSIYTRKNVPITSGSEDILEEAIMHIALVTHPIELNQENFKLKDNTETHLVMSNMVTDSEESDDQEEEVEDESSNSDLTQLINDLRESCKLYLPPSTTIDNLVENLSIAVNQYKLLNTETANSDSDSYEVEPLLMSHLQQAQIDALINGKVTNPLTSKPYAKEDFAQAQQPQQNVQDQLIMSAMQNSMQADRRKAYRSRIDSLVASGRTTKAFAEQKLYPQADNYVLQFDKNQILEPVVESLIMSLESMPAPTQQETPLVMSLDTNAEDDASLQKTASYMASLV